MSKKIYGFFTYVLAITTTCLFVFFASPITKTHAEIEPPLLITEVVDTEAPAAPTGLKATPGIDYVELGWDSNNESDLAGYNVYVNGTFFETTDNTGLTVQPLDLGREYMFEVTAIDLVGNESNQSEIVSGPAENAPVPELLITEVVPDTDNYA